MAFLTPISESGEANSSPPISIALDEITFGSDPSQVSQVIDDTSVEGAHARLQRMEAGEFRLFDLGSVAGTWINYMPVSKDGALLEHGDLIHIGRVGFRFTLRDPGRIRRPVIIPQGPKP
jgi:pSer/pThr/pTyr-binding forkhead associated (FHA) protein